MSDEASSVKQLAKNKLNIHNGMFSPSNLLPCLPTGLPHRTQRLSLAVRLKSWCEGTAGLAVWTLTTSGHEIPRDFGRQRNRLPALREGGLHVRHLGDSLSRHMFVAVADDIFNFKQSSRGSNLITFLGSNQ